MGRRRHLGAALIALALAGCGSGDDGAGPTCTTCFLHGQWRLDNLSPCFSVDPSNHVTGATSTFLSGGVAMCPTDSTTRPAMPWSTDTLTVDCPGHYTMCLTLKAGSSTAPQASDCTVATACAEGDYTTADTAQSWPAVESWIASGAAQLACAQTFVDSGGYAELSATGGATGCGSVTTVFGRVRYCPLSCNTNPTGPSCTMCGAGSTGTF